MVRVLSGDSYNGWGLPVLPNACKLADTLAATLWVSFIILFRSWRYRSEGALMCILPTIRPVMSSTGKETPEASLTCPFTLSAYPCLRIFGIMLRSSCGSVTVLWVKTHSLALASHASKAASGRVDRYSSPVEHA